MRALTPQEVEALVCAAASACEPDRRQAQAIGREILTFMLSEGKMIRIRGRIKRHFFGGENAGGARLSFCTASSPTLVGVKVGRRGSRSLPINSWDFNRFAIGGGA